MILLGPRSKEGVAVILGVAVITVIVGGVLPEFEVRKVVIVIVVLEMTITDVIEDELLDDEDREVDDDDEEDEDLDDDNSDEDLEVDVEEDRELELELELEEELLNVGASELLLKLEELRLEDDEVEEACVKVVVVKLLTKVVLVVKMPVEKGSDEDVAFVGHSTAQHLSVRLSVVAEEKTPV